MRKRPASATIYTIVMAAAETNSRWPPGDGGPPAPDPPDPAQPVRHAPLGRAVLYPNLYTWYVLLAALDITLTWVILHLGGRELNWLANWIIDRYDLRGVVVFKFLLLLFVVLVCELAGRHSRQTGLRLARWAVVITAFAVVVALIHLLRTAVLVYMLPQPPG